MKKIFAILTAFVLLAGFVIASDPSGVTAPQDNEVDPGVTYQEPTQPESSSESSSGSDGGYSGRPLTKYGWDGTECVKRDVYFYKKVFNSRTYEWSEVPTKVIEGEDALAWEKGKMITKPVCDKTVIEIEALPFDWHRR